MAVMLDFVQRARNFYKNIFKKHQITLKNVLKICLEGNAFYYVCFVTLLVYLF